jgi:dienelactone hydrolase
MPEKYVEYLHEGATLEGFLAWDDSRSGPLPGVLVAHAWGGRTDFEIGRARELAKLGYAGFALDLYGKGVTGSGPEENTKLMTPFLEDRSLLQARMTKALDVLREQAEVDASRTAAIGYCFGGLCVLDLARMGTEIRGVASFHGLFNAPGNTTGTKIKAKVLALHGHEDPMVPPEAVNELEKELTDAGADWQIHVYGNTKHAFAHEGTNFPDLGAVYDATADQRSWQSLRNFLEELF